MAGARLAADTRGPALTIATFEEIAERIQNPAAGALGPDELAVLKIITGWDESMQSKAA